jgi:hypothetical protein
MDNISELETELARANDALSKVIQSRSMQGWTEADQAVLLLERRLAAAKGEEHAVPLDFPVRWDCGAPCPHLFANDYKTFLAFYVREDDPDWDGTFVRVVSPADGVNARLALVKFDGCSSARLGTPNDEVFSGHPLHGKGLEGYTAQEVQNSNWIAELQQINSVHSQYRPERWRDRHHYIFWFHDSTFECIASGFSVERFEGTWRDLMNIVCERMLT